MAIEFGIDRIGEAAPVLQGRRIGLITGPTGIDAEWRSTIDVLQERFGLAAMFSPEHGVRGDIAAGGWSTPTSTSGRACRYTACTARTPSG